MHFTALLQFPKHPSSFPLSTNISLPLFTLLGVSITMKRHRNILKVPNKLREEVKKRKKKEMEEQVVKVEEEKEDSRDSVAMAVEMAVAGEEEAWVSNGVVDEQMSWGLLWFPCWDVEFMGDAYNQLYSDVVWEDDVWNLRSITEIPNPCERER